MDHDKRLGRSLGATLLVVFTGSILTEALTLSLFSDTTADTLDNIADNTALLRWATVMELCITSVGIVVLAALLYAAVKHQNPLLAMLAFGCAIAEATILAVSTLGAFLLVPVSETYAQAGSSSPEPFRWPTACASSTGSGGKSTMCSSASPAPSGTR